jgi:hypothetical protein
MTDPGVDLQIDQIIVCRIPPVARGTRIELDACRGAECRLRNARQRLDVWQPVTALAAIAIVGELQALVVIETEIRLGQPGMRFQLRVEDFLSGPVVGQP